MLVLTILDGWGHSEKREGNALMDASTPFFDRLDKEEAKTIIDASGNEVGLLPGQMGNSEVGHLNIGAGRVVFQNLPRISNAISDGSFFEIKAFEKAMANAKEGNKALHLIGLLSDGGVHSHINHIFGLLEMARKNGLQENVYLHMLLDGRDTPPQSAEKYITELQTGAGDTAKISTIMGRFYGMDRDDRWDRVEAAYNAMVHGDGVKGTDALFALKKSYEDGVYDEFVQPQVFLAADNDGEKTGQVKHGDSVIFFNFRADRMRELVRAFFDPDFTGFKRGEPLKDLSIVCMTEYESTFSLPVAFHPVALQNTLGEWLSKKGLKQFHTAETEKYAHVTFFFNGGVEAPVKGEARELIASPKVRTYDLKPEMSAHEVTDIVLRQVNEGEYDFIVVNLANPDMVGHTGNFEAAKKAVETIDSCVEKIVDRVQKKGGKILITADHGNIEKLLEDDGSICTAHTTNPVPFYCLTGKKVSLRSGGKLADIAPTILHMLDIRKPEDMTGESLILE